MIPLRALMKTRQGIIIDSASIFLILSAFLFFGVQMFIFLPDILTVPSALNMVIRSTICFAFLIGGVVMCMLLRTLNPFSTRFVDENLDADEISNNIAIAIVDLMMITVINFITFQYTPLKTAFAVTPHPLFSQVAFSFFVGITEEVVFRGAVLVYFSNITWSPFGILFSTIAWWIFHGGVYQLDFKPMVIIVCSGFVLSATFLMSKNRLSVPMIPHGVNNILAYMVQSVVPAQSASVVLRLAPHVLRVLSHV